MKLYELQKGTKVKLNDDILEDEKERIVEFIYVDGMYGLWRHGDNTLIMGHANQDVSEYGDILDYYHKDEEDES